MSDKKLKNPNISQMFDPVGLSDDFLNRIDIVWNHNEDPFYCRLLGQDKIISQESVRKYRVNKKDQKFLDKLSDKILMDRELTEVEFQFFIKSLFYLMTLETWKKKFDQDKYDSIHQLLNDVLYVSLGEKFTLEKIEIKNYIYIK